MIAEPGRRSIVGMVIVIDEDEPLRTLLVEWLVAAGHADARELAPGELGADAGGDWVELVVIDLPRMRPRLLLARVRAAWPHAALLGLSTQVRASLPPGSPLVRELGLVGLLAKPCSRDELLATVAEALRWR